MCGRGQSECRRSTSTKVNEFTSTQLGQIGETLIALPSARTCEFLCEYSWPCSSPPCWVRSFLVPCTQRTPGGWRNKLKWAGGMVCKNVWLLNYMHYNTVHSAILLVTSTYRPTPDVVLFTSSNRLGSPLVTARSRVARRCAGACFVTEPIGTLWKRRFKPPTWSACFQKLEGTPWLEGTTINNYKEHPVRSFSWKILTAKNFQQFVIQDMACMQPFPFRLGQEITQEFRRRSFHSELHLYSEFSLG